MLVLATVLSRDWTLAEVLEPREIWNTDTIAVTAQWITASTLKSYCQARYEAAKEAFQVKLLRELRKTEGGANEARFGTVVIVSGFDMKEDEVEKLRGELGQLAQLIKRPDHEDTIDIEEVDKPSETEASRLRQDLVKELRDKHGGTKLKQSLEICTDGENLIKLTGSLLDRPDDPAEELPDVVRGSPDEISFSKCWVKLKLESKDRLLKLYVSDQEVWDQIVLAGRNSEVVLLTIRTVEVARSSRIEATKCQIERRNLDPMLTLAEN